MKQNGLVVFFLTVSCVVGVGVFTGQEVLTYFGRASFVGLVCAALSCGAFFFLLKICLTLSKSSAYQKLAAKKWFKIATCMIYTIVAGAMLSALVGVFGTVWPSIVVCAVGAVFATAFSRFFDKINVLLCLLMIGVVVWLASVNISVKAPIELFSRVKLPFFKSISFAAFNLFLCAPFLSRRGEGMSEKQIFRISFASSVVMFTLIVLSMFALCSAGNVMPFLKIAGGNTLYLVTLCIAAMTTLFAMFSSIKSLTGSPVAFSASVMAALALCAVPFDHIVNVFYLGASVFACLFFVLVARKKTERGETEGENAIAETTNERRSG